MKIHLSVVIVALTFLVMSPDRVDAQQPRRFSSSRVQTYNRPATSPYLDLLAGNRAGRSFATQYYRQVRPELEFRQATTQLSASVRQLQSQTVEQQAFNRGLSEIIRTGHRTSFLNYGQYYSFQSSRR